jgi:predicted KAP-like P-loop ATPase
MSEVTQEQVKAEDNPLLNKIVYKEGPLKDMLVSYVGEKLKPENDEVTVHMIVSVIAEEFPEFVYLLAEENFLRGYQQALEDVEKFNSSQETEPQSTHLQELR